MAIVVCFCQIGHVCSGILPPPSLPSKFTYYSLWLIVFAVALPEGQPCVIPPRNSDLVGHFYCFDLQDFSEIPVDIWNIR
jgi:hypothetical protein